MGIELVLCIIAIAQGGGAGAGWGVLILLAATGFLLKKGKEDKNGTFVTVALVCAIISAILCMIAGIVWIMAGMTLMLFWPTAGLIIAVVGGANMAISIECILAACCACEVNKEIKSVAPGSPPVPTPP